MKTTNSFLKIAQIGQVGIVTLNDPQRLNALSMPMGAEFANTLLAMQSHPTIRVILLNGNGNNFSSGGDFKMLLGFLKQKTATVQKELLKFYNYYLTVARIAKPVIALVQGQAVGAGFCLAMACDFCLAGTNALFSPNFAKLGITPGMGATFVLPHKFGASKASKILLSAQSFSAKQAHQYGLVTQITAPSKLLTQGLLFAKTLAKNSPQALAKIKKSLLPQREFSKSLLAESKLQALSFGTSDAQEGFKAALEKRSPQFL